MKTLITLLLAILASSAVFGQWSLGPKLSYGTVSTSARDIRIIPNSDRIPVNLSYLGGGNAASLGFMVHNNIGPGFLQFEILGTRYNQSYAAQTYGDTSPAILLDEKVYLLEMPLAAGVNIRNFRLGGGPVLEVNVQKTTDLDQIAGYVNKTDKLGGAFQFLLGFQKGIFNMDARYVYKFNSIVDEFGIYDDNLRLNKGANRFMISMGLLFGGKNNNGLDDVMPNENEIKVF